MNLLEKIDLIPLELADYIKEYISVDILLQTSKTYYEKYIMMERFNKFKNGPISNRFYHITLDTYINRVIKNDFTTR